MQTQRAQTCMTTPIVISDYQHRQPELMIVGVTTLVVGNLKMTHAQTKPTKPRHLQTI